MSAKFIDQFVKDARSLMDKENRILAEQKEMRERDPRPSEEIVREQRSEWDRK